MLHKDKKYFCMIAVFFSLWCGMAYSSPFCLVTRSGTNCNYSSYQACVDSANNESICVVNQREISLRGSGLFCSVERQVANCSYNTLDDCFKSGGFSSSLSGCILNPNLLNGHEKNTNNCSDKYGVNMRCLYEQADRQREREQVFFAKQLEMQNIYAKKNKDINRSFPAISKNRDVLLADTKSYISKESLNKLSERANSGDLASQLELSSRYGSGIGLPRDDKAAAYWTRLAANQGHIGSIGRLADYYYNGIGFPEDKSKAIDLYLSAARAGNPNSQFKLGRMYFLGENVKKDNEKAIYWLTLSAEKGNAEAKKMLEKIKE